jgi:ATP-dependent DNA helicase DinG
MSKSRINDLGNWAVIDIETTGIDPGRDEIIDVGFLQFEGTKLIRKYSSLVRTEQKLSKFITKLTNITDEMVSGAPTLELVEDDIGELYGHHLIAHNASFEESFLAPIFDHLEDGEERESYQDSIPFLGLLFLNQSSLSLENLINHLRIADHEVHRGYEDSRDLLKVLLLACFILSKDREAYQSMRLLFATYNLNQYFYAKFLFLTRDELFEIAEQIDFNLDESFDLYIEGHVEEDQLVISDEKLFELEFSGENIKNIYKNENSIKKKFPNYLYRESQEQLSLKLGQAFKNRIHAMVQAPTGTGKTLGYLIPTALFSINEDKQVLVATGTKTLQRQAMSKDVPMLRHLLGLSESELKVTELIGSNNHYCELLFRQSREEEDLFSADRSFDEQYTDLYFDSLFLYNSNQPYKNQLTRNDTPYVLKRKIKPMQETDQAIAVDFRSCSGSLCPFKKNCSYINGLREAKDANIIIGNHALMFSWPKGFPRPEFVVVDEAHKIEGETTRAFSYEINAENLKTLAKSLNHLQGIGSLFYLLAQNETNEGESTQVITELREQSQDTYNMMMDHLLVLPDKLELFFKRKPRYTDIFWNESPLMANQIQTDPQERSILDHFESLKFILENLYNILLPYESRFDAKEFLKSSNDENLVIAVTRFEKFMGSMTDLIKAFEMGLEDNNEYARSLKFHEKQGFILESSPINVGKVLHDGLLQTSASVFYTSATLGNALGDRGIKGIEWATGYLYLEPEKRFKQGFYLPAAFDYKNKTKVFLCDDTPSIHDRNFVSNTLKDVVPMIKELGGRSLLLYSSKKRFEAAREYMLEKLDGHLPLFIQGMGLNVVDDFKNTAGGVLMGMESFGEGIDIPGDKLQFVFIDKIPDLRMDYVIQKRRDFYEANLGNEFTDYYLSTRARSLHQKLGRLLRTEKDHGGVIIVDSRVKKWKGRTMEQLVKLMEPYQLERGGLAEACDSVKEFILGH